MAKLSAYGRTEIYRLIRHQAKLCLMSDGVSLINYGYGWKRAAKLGRPGSALQTPEDWLHFYLGQGWQRI